MNERKKYLTEERKKERKIKEITEGRTDEEK
jgi:hypothetical protein